MRNIQEFIEKNKLEKNFESDAKSGDIVPTRETLNQIQKFIDTAKDTSDQISILVEENIEAEVKTFIEPTDIKNFEIVGRVMMVDNKSARGLSIKLKADVVVQKIGAGEDKQGLGEKIVYLVALSDAKGAIKSIEDRMKKEPLLEVFLTPSSMLFREDLYHAICLIQGASNLSKQMDILSGLKEEVLEAMAPIYTPHGKTKPRAEGNYRRETYEKPEAASLPGKKAV